MIRYRRASHFLRRDGVSARVLNRESIATLMSFPGTVRHYG